MLKLAISLKLLAAEIGHKSKIVGTPYNVCHLFFTCLFVVLGLVRFLGRKAVGVHVQLSFRCFISQQLDIG